MNLLIITSWTQNHPARAGTLAGWYQQFCGLLATAIAMPFILDPAILSPELSGLWLAFQSTLMLVNLTDFGLSIAISRQVAFSFTRAERTETAARDDFIRTASGWPGIAAVYATGRKLFFWLNLVAFGVLVVVYEGLLPLGDLLKHRTASVDCAWYLLGVATILSLQCRLYQGILDGLGRLYLGRLISGTVQFFSGAGIIVVLKVRPNLALMAVVVFAMSAVQWMAFRAALFALARGRLRPEAGTPRIPLARLWPVAVPLGMVSSAAFLVSCVQVPVLGSLLGSAIVAPFYLAQRIGQTLTTALLQLLAPQMPLFTQEIAAGKDAEAATRMWRALRMISAAAVAGFAVFLAFSPWVVDVWIGEGKYVDRTTLLVLAADYLFMTLSVGMAHFVLASGRNPFVVPTLASGLLNVAGCFWLTRSCGVTGPALAGLAAGLLTNYWFAPWKAFSLLAGLRRSHVAKAPPER
jgi:O-antigen/teichoic acid export membrane protein